MTLITAELPEIYWLKKTIFTCNNCDFTYEVLMPSGNELIKFVEKDGVEERWLPTYRKGGYLDLVENLVENFKKNDEITVKVAKNFENKFSPFQQLSAKGNCFTTIFNVLCPNCQSDDSKVNEETLIQSPKILWLYYDLEKKRT